jgi:hypothetical protein
VNHLVTHGLALVRNQIKRRVKVQHRAYVDKRFQEGRDALRIQAGLVDDQGGINGMTTGRFIAIQELTNLYYLGAMMDRKTAEYLKRHPERKHPKALARLFSYRQPVSNQIARYLELLGLDKRPPPAKSLDEIIAEQEEPEQP